MQYCGYLTAIRFTQCSTELSCHSANPINIAILALAQPDYSDYPCRQLPKRMNDANFLRLALNLISADERANGPIQSLIYSSGGFVRLFHTFKKADHNGISFDLSYVPNYNFDLQNPSPQNMQISEHLFYFIWIKN
jgi:hypothetical protein